MGRSTTSCFSIITCGSHSDDRDDIQASESKSSSDKRGWSFRKRSSSHRVLSNTVISEVPSSVNKDGAESANVEFETQAKSVIPEKSSEVERTEEVPQFSTSINPEVSEVTTDVDVDSKFDVKRKEYVIVVIQAGIRRILAEKELLKLKSTVKLQAAVRGHLVRRHAVGSLRCVQAIIKMQALVRARRTQIVSEGSIIEEKQHEKLGKHKQTPKLQGKEKSGARPDVTYTTIEKLLSNRFARQLLESSPRTKTINIKCDPLSSDSAWKWLERWAASSSTDAEQLHKPESSENHQEQDILKCPENENIILLSTEYAFQSDANEAAAVPFSNSDANEAVVPCESEENLVNNKVEKPRSENLEILNSTEISDNRPSDSVYQFEVSSHFSKYELETEQPKHSMKRVATEPETEGRKYVSGSRKASNPAFIAAQSKFEELVSTTNSANLISSSNMESDIESGKNKEVSSALDGTSRINDIKLAEQVIADTPKVLVTGSECGTELSISSTLDSPDLSEVGAVKFEQETNILEEGIDNSMRAARITVETKDDSTFAGSNLLHPIIQPEKQNDSGGLLDEPLENTTGDDSYEPGQKVADSSSDMLIELEHGSVHQVDKSSPEASPRSHMTVHESQGTPSSQVSTTVRKTKSEKTISPQKRKSLSAGKRSSVGSSNDSGVRSSSELLPKDLKIGNRRNSVGSAKSNHVDQEESRDSSSSHSRPSYMQATESARAKAYANSSPRSSPDVQDKEFYIKKRHSLPVANGRQGSPRIQRSLSQAQQSMKGNGTNLPQERKWQR